MKRLIIIASCIFLSQISSGQVMMFFTKDSLNNITSPLDLDSLFYWFAADVGVTDSLGGAIATDEGVGTWNDLSGNGYHVTQTTNTKRPVYKATGGPGSKPTIQFDGSNDFLASAAHWWGSDDLTVFVVMKFGNATRDTFNFVLTRWNYTNAKRQWQLSAGNNTSDPPNYRPFFRTANTASNGKYYQVPDGSNTAFALHSISLNGSGTETWAIDGGSKVVTETNLAGTYAIQDATDYLLISTQNFPSPGLYARITVSEIIVYSRALTATERAAIENYLNKKYDLY